MITLVKTYTRPSVTVPWVAQAFIPRDTYLARFNGHYLSTGKCLGEYVEISDDDLVMTYTAYWKTIEDYEEYSADPILRAYWDARNQYYGDTDVAVGKTTISTT